jgi:hypothetical protein
MSIARLWSLVALTSLALVGGACASSDSAEGRANVGHATDAIRSGRVAMPDGQPVPAAWVTLVRPEAPTAVAHSVSTDANGEFAIEPPDGAGPLWLRLRTGTHEDIWYRGPDARVPDPIVLPDARRRSPAEAARALPPDAWWSMLRAPSDERLQELGWDGRGLKHDNEGLGQRDAKTWLSRVHDACLHCHSMGGPLTRWPRTRGEWNDVLNARFHSVAGPRVFGANEELVLDALTDWSDRIRKGATPATDDTHRGRARVSEWSIGTPYSWSRVVAVRHLLDSSVKAKGPDGDAWAYTHDMAHDRIIGLKVQTGEVREWPLEFDFVWAGRHSFRGESLNRPGVSPHSLFVGQGGELWINGDFTDEDPACCGGFDDDKPIPLLGSMGEEIFDRPGNYDLGRLDVTSGAVEVFVTTCRSMESRQAPDGSWWSYGDPNGVCSLNPADGSETTHGIKTPFGSRLGLIYGATVTPNGRLWFSQRPANRIGSLSTSDQQMGEMHEIPAPGFAARIPDFDADGNVWWPLHSGHLAKLDVKTMGWQFFELPGPKHDETVRSAVYPQAVTVDRGGLVGPKGNIYITAPNSDALYAFEPKTQTFTRYALPMAGAFLWQVFVDDGALLAVTGPVTTDFIEPWPFEERARPRLLRIELLTGQEGE